MASFKFYYICLCLFISSGVQGGELQKYNPEIDRSAEDGSNLSKNISSASNQGGHRDRLLHGRFNATEIWKNRSQTIVQLLNNVPNVINHWASLKTGPSDIYLGAQATLNVYGLPSTGSDEASSALILMANGVNSSPDNLNTLAAGWHVNQELYGDYDTYFFIVWTSQGENKGCYNLICKGFVPDPSAKLVPGTRIRPLSTYNGPQYDITLKIFRDMYSGDWWLYSGHNADQPVGYWPNSLFTSLTEYASTIQIGGVVNFPNVEPSPPMGSGHFPSEGHGKAAYIKDVMLSNGDGWKLNPPLDFYQDRADCYQIAGGDGTFNFGGRGRCLN